MQPQHRTVFAQRAFAGSHCRHQLIVHLPGGSALASAGRTGPEMVAAVSSTSETIVKAVFRTFLRSFDGYVLPETNTATPDRAAAEAAFAQLVNRAYLDGQNWAAVLSYNDSQIASHRFDCRPGDADYWRDKMGDIRWPSGRIGRPRRMEGGRRINIYLDSISLEAADKLGGGNISEGIRLALAALRAQKQ